MDRTVPTPLARWAAAPSASRSGPLGRLLALMALRRSRLDLAALDDHLLRDVGLSRAEAQREARRPAWSGREGRHEPAGEASAWSAPARGMR